MTSEELHWLAGWLEGEGTFVVTSGKSGSSGKRYPRIRVNGCSTDRDVLDYVQGLAGGVVNGPYKRSSGPGKDVFTWTLSTHKQSLPLMRQLEPLMRAQRRKDQIRKAIDAAEAYMNVPQGQKGI